MTTVLTILATLIFVALFILIMSLGGIYIHQKKIFEAIRKPKEVKVDYPAETMMEILDRIQNVEVKSIVNSRFIELFASMYLVQLNSQFKTGHINKDDAKELADIYGAIAGVLNYLRQEREAWSKAEQNNNEKN